MTHDLLSRIKGAATINTDSDVSRGEALLLLIQDDDGQYRWYGTTDCQNWEDCGVSGETVEGAEAEALAAWPGSDWDLQSPWMLGY